MCAVCARVRVTCVHMCMCCVHMCECCVHMCVHCVHVCVGCAPRASQFSGQAGDLQVATSREHSFPAVTLSSNMHVRARAHTHTHITPAFYCTQVTSKPHPAVITPS